MMPSRPAAVAADDRAAVSPLLMVSVTLDGVMLPEVDGVPVRALGLGELRLLEALAGRGAPSLGAVGHDGDGLEGFVDELRMRGLITAPGARAATRAIEGVEATAAAREPADRDQLVLVTPVILRLGSGGFEHFDHDGHVRIRLDAVELVAAAEFRHPVTSAQARLVHERGAGGAALGERAFAGLVRRLIGAGLLERFDPDDPSLRVLSRQDREIRRAVARQWALAAVVDRRLAEHDAAERERQTRTGTTRTPVMPVHFQWQIPPLALGMIVAYAREHDGGRLREYYDFRPTWLSEPGKAWSPGEGPAIYLFSHYIWSSARNLAMSAELKAQKPTCLTIHGGPDVPKYEGDVEAYFRAHPHVDVAVHGEGELTTAAALAALADGGGDISALESVPGLSFRVRDRLVRTPDRDRIVDLDRLPSPYLTGVFDSFGATSTASAVLETNRGCPYGCTFCDWGSAIASRIRTFSLDRVFAELEWCARHRVETVGLADANFGIFERDVAIAEKVAELKRQYGYPRHLGLNYAKNSLKHLKPIVKILIDAGVLAYGQISLQSTDEKTLDTIQRSNIKLEKYHELAGEFRRGGLPLFIDLMMGLPGSTVDSFRRDMQQSIDREVIPKIYPTQLLVNSPMNEPNYRRAHGIEVAPGAFVTSAATFTRRDYEEMRKLRRVFLLLEKFGVLRHVARYVRQESGTLEMDFFARLWRDARADRERWPVTAFTLEAVPGLMVPPGRWQLFLDEIRTYLIEVTGIVDDDALATVLAVQGALLPARKRRFPETVALPHDYAAWHSAMLVAKDGGHLDDWTRIVPPLRQFAPGVFTVDDPLDVCRLGIGHTVESDSYGAWELDSPVSRRVTPFHAVLN